MKNVASSDRITQVASWNVNGLRAVAGKGFLDAFLALDADILALQEIKAQPQQLPETIRHIEGYQSYWNPAVKKGYSGTAVFTRKAPLDVRYGLGVEAFDTEGRVLTLEFDDFFLINAYFPNAQPGLTRLAFKLEFNRQIQALMDRLSRKKSTVLCGDLNVAHKPVDLARPEANEENPGYSAAERNWLDQIVAAGYIDTFRVFDNSPQRYTWWSYRANARAKNIGWRIDYFLVDPGSRERLVGAAIHDEIDGSDHCPISLQFR